MTVIAYCNGIMASDSRETQGDDSVNQCEKLFRKKIGKHWHVIGTAGGSYSGMVFVDWYGTDAQPPETLTQHLDLEEDFEVMVWNGKEQALYTANHLCRLVKVVEPFYAVGSGRKAALAAMHMGANATRAVEIACKIDAYCAPPVQSIRVK
jgi:ATP-dependent protease HslVU (ClpYQ) peptidase subunit